MFNTCASLLSYLYLHLFTAVPIAALLYAGRSHKMVKLIEYSAIGMAKAEGTEEIPDAVFLGLDAEFPALVSITKSFRRVFGAGEIRVGRSGHHVSAGGPVRREAERPLEAPRCERQGSHLSSARGGDGKDSDEEKACGEGAGASHSVVPHAPAPLGDPRGSCR